MEFKFVLDNLIHVVLIGVLGLMGWAAKRLLFDPFAKTQIELTKHVDMCNEIPKSLIIEKIENLCDKVEVHQTYEKEMRMDIKEDIKSLNDSVNLLILHKK